MGKITLTVEGTTVGTVANGGGVVLVKEVSEQDSGRLVQAYARGYAGRWKDINGNTRNPSIHEVLEAWWDGVVAGSIANVHSIEKEVAAEAARAAVQEISVS